MILHFFYFKKKKKKEKMKKKKKNRVEVTFMKVEIKIGAVKVRRRMVTFEVKEGRREKDRDDCVGPGVVCTWGSTSSSSSL